MSFEDVRISGHGTFGTSKISLGLRIVHLSCPKMRGGNSLVGEWSASFALPRDMASGASATRAHELLVLRRPHEASVARPPPHALHRAV